jgi:1-acyl-sn-glycerol-3-phosphate acyltransferase
MSAALPAVLGERPVLPGHLRGHPLARALLRAAGWRLCFDGLPARQGVLIVYPHTSNWDVVVAMVAKWSIGLPVVFFGKDSLFELPVLGGWLRALGGLPVDRRTPHGVVEQMAARLTEARERDEFFWLALSPEGTRSHASHWRSGFYQLTLQAGVPLGLAYIDFERKEVGIDSFLRLSGQAQRDMAAIAKRLSHRRGKRPELAAPVRLK